MLHGCCQQVQQDMGLLLCVVYSNKKQIRKDLGDPPLLISYL